MESMILPLRRYAEFRGRSPRKEYWLFILLQWLIFLPLGLLFLALGGDVAQLRAAPFTLQLGPAGLVQVLVGIAIAVLLLPFIAVQVRRLHDQGRRGWWLLLNLVPFGQLPLLALMCLDGTAGPNRYGPDPKRRDSVHRRDWRDAPVDVERDVQRPSLGDGW